MHRPASLAQRLTAFCTPLLQSPRERARPPSLRLRLIATLFGRASNVLMVAVAAAVCGGAAWVRGGVWLAGLVSGVEIALLLARCLVILRFKARQNEGAFDPDPWLVGFGLLAVGSSMCWGSLCLLALALAHDPVLYVLPVLATVGTAGAVAARNSGVPRLAKLQLAVSLSPILLGSLLADDHGFRLLLILVPAMAAGLLILVAERNEQLVELIEMQDELARLSETDALTQLPNRRALDARIARGADTRFGCCVLMVDVDNFKLLNDRHGHLAGDVLLRKVADVLRETLRDSDDVVARYGGEEFAVVLRGTDLVHAAAVAERLRATVSVMCRNPFDGTALTISVGYAVAQPGDDFAVTLRSADEALFRAKRAGRNRVEGAHRLERLDLRDVA